MAVLSFLYRNGLWISVPAFLLSLALVIFFIVSIIRIVRKSPIIRVPIVKQQEIEFTEGGRMDLCIEGPQLTTRFAGLDYALISPYGTEVMGHGVLFRTRTSWISQVRMKLKTYEIPHPGRYAFQIQGLKEDWTPDTKHRIVFAKPYTAVLVGYIIGVVFSALFNIGSIVLFFMRFTSMGNGA